MQIYYLNSSISLICYSIIFPGRHRLYLFCWPIQRSWNHISYSRLQILVHKVSPCGIIFYWNHIKWLEIFLNRDDCILLKCVEMYAVQPFSLLWIIYSAYLKLWWWFLLQVLSMLHWRKQQMPIRVQESCTFLCHFCCTIVQISCLQ